MLIFSTFICSNSFIFKKKHKEIIEEKSLILEEGKKISKPEH